ncbi:MAG: tetratricopeptide repeat protein [Sphingobacteriaceae bacterium]|nr:tetratricopeptide repeat protein [Sphingobacteriaceae bacterium]
MFQHLQVNAQDHVIDSLKLALQNAKHDTTRCNILNAIIESENDDAVWPKYNDQLKGIAETNLKKTPQTHPVYKIFNKHLAVALHRIGHTYKSQGDIPKALENFNNSLKICEEIGDKKEIATLLNNLGVIYFYQGDIQKALEQYARSLKIREEIGDKSGIAFSLNNLAFIYQKQDDIPNALKYFSMSLKMREEIGDKKGIATVLNNIGAIYYDQGDPLNTSFKQDALSAGFTKALEYFDRSLKIKEEIGDKLGTANLLNNIGVIYSEHGDPSVTSSKEDALSAGFTKALEYYGKSLKIREEIGDKEAIAATLNNIGVIYIKQKKYSKALDFCTRSMKASREIGFPQYIRDASERLNQIYKATGNYKLALENYELYIKMRDSINNESTRKASIKNQLKYEYDKQAAADSVAHAKDSEIKNAELAKQTAEIKAKKNQQYALFSGLGLVLIFAGVMFNRFKVTQKQKGIIESQKSEVESQKKIVEEKQKEVLDSIHYARRIQMAQIPSEKVVERILAKLKS